MSREFAAHVGDNLLAVTSHILSVQPIVTGMSDTGNVLQGGQISMLNEDRDRGGAGRDAGWIDALDPSVVLPIVGKRQNLS